MSSKSKLMQVLGILVTLVIVLALAAPVFAFQFVRNGTFAGGSTNWTNVVQTGTRRPWVISTTSAKLDTANTRVGYMWQCINVTTEPTDHLYNGSADFLGASTGASVDFHFFLEADCPGGIDGSPADTQAVDVANPVFVNFLAPSFTASILVVAVCPGNNAYCEVDNISLDGADGTAITLNTMSARSEQPLLAVALLAVLLLTSGSIVVWQLRRYSKLG